MHVTPHQFRHTLATRLVNNEVPLDTVQRLLDHNSPEMTARYAQIKDQTLRREWERYQQRINIRGEIVALDPNGPRDAAWAKENLARAKQTLPNGSCGLPLQQTCPHPNACLTCDSFLTTVEFLPATATSPGAPLVHAHVFTHHDQGEGCIGQPQPVHRSGSGPHIG